MVLSLPASASTGVRANGASTRVMPAAWQRAAKRRVESGSLVDASMTIKPARAWLNKPVGPSKAAST